MKKYLSLAMILLLLCTSCATTEAPNPPATSGEPSDAVTTDKVTEKETDEETEELETLEILTDPPVTGEPMEDIKDAAFNETKGNAPEYDEDPFIGTKVAELFATKNSFVIDGTLDDAYKTDATLLQLDTKEEFVAWSGGLEEARAWVTYDAEYLYVYAMVFDSEVDYSNEDNQVWNKDGISVMMDFAYNREKVEYGDNEPKLSYLTVACDGTKEGYHVFSDKEIETAAVIRKNGYAIEMKLPLLAGFEGTDIGFEIQAADACDGEKVGCATWDVSGEQMYCYTHVAGTMSFNDNLWN